jgi:integrase
MPIKEFIETYRAYSETHKRPKSHRTDFGRVSGFVSTLQVEDLQDVTTADVEQYFAKKVLEDAVSLTTILRIREALHAFFRHAQRLGFLRENPVAATKRPRIQRRDPRFLSHDQIGECLAAVRGDRIEAATATFIYSGIRREELCWLTWDDVDLKSARPVLRIRAKTINGESWMPKTKRDRVVPISIALLAFLRAVPRAHPIWVFPSPNGHRWNPDNLTHRFVGILRGKGLPWTLLDLRHTFGSQLAMKGLSDLKIAQLMGNSPEIARRHYIHLRSEEMHSDVEF